MQIEPLSRENGEGCHSPENVRTPGLQPSSAPVSLSDFRQVTSPLWASVSSSERSSFHEPAAGFPPALTTSSLMGRGRRAGLYLAVR